MLLKSYHGEPGKSVTDKLSSYGVAHQDLISDTSRDTNDRAELSHQSTWVRERGMRRFKSTQQAQRFLSVRSVVHELLNPGRNLISVKLYGLFRQRAFSSWEYVAVV